MNRDARLPPPLHELLLTTRRHTGHINLVVHPGRADNSRDVILPEPDDLSQIMERWHRIHWQPPEQSLTDAVVALGRALSVNFAQWQAEVLALGSDLDRHRVAMSLPHLQLRQVLTEGLVPYIPESR